jgi:hypothetical protein
LISWITSSWGGLSQDEWAELNVEKDAAKGFESFMSSDFEVQCQIVATYIIRSQTCEQSSIYPLSGAAENPGDMS